MLVYQLMIMVEANPKRTKNDTLDPVNAKRIIKVPDRSWLLDWAWSSTM